jgi:hypothetical protein
LAAFATLMALGWMACSIPAPPPEVHWERDGARDGELEADISACQQEAAGTRAESKRFEHVAKGSAFMRCMTDRGWRQVAGESTD